MDARTIFMAALDLDDPSSRAAYLDTACQGDSPLRERVEALLRSNEEAGSFLQGRASNVLATIDQPISEQVGSVIGPYKLREQLGEGGMGIVYVAEQEQPVRRKVALKVIKPGMDTKEVIARFGAEQQALAMMDHPNIARVLDAGATEAGRPYFVMELVPGVPVTEYLDRHKLPTRQRLELFIQICQAVQHAHLKGIIHRDIKPSNVLITLHDGVPVPKVIDFGVAKAINQRLTEQTVYTQVSQMIGTPLYMSPEQAELSGLNVDTRTDIYSLGVLLYELLTGTTPFAKEQLSEAGYDEMRRIIREEEPPRPSDRISTLEAQAVSTVSERHRSDPRKLTQTVRGELDWIVMKALEKDRTRRYESASSFAADIQRYLDDEAVEACPPSTAYRLKKYAKRNKAFLTTTALVFVSLIAGTGVATWQASVARGERNRAQLSEQQSKLSEHLAKQSEQRAKESEHLAKQSEQRAKESEQRAKESEQRAKQSEEKAQQESAIAKVVTDFLQKDLLGKSNRDETPNPEVKLRTILDRAAAEIQGKFKDQPLVEAAIRDTIGQAYRALGRYRQAEPHQTRAVELAQRQLGGEDARTLRYSARLGSLTNRLGRYKKAEQLLGQTLETQLRILGEEHPNTLASMDGLASVYSKQGRHDEAEKLYLQTLEIQKRTRAEEHPNTLATLNNLALVYSKQGRHDEAEKLHLQTLEIRKRTLGEEHPITLSSMNNLATVYSDQGRHDEAEKLHLQTLAIKKRTLGEEHPITLGSMNNLAGVYNAQGRHDEAEKMFMQTLAIEKRTLGEEHPSMLSSMYNLATVYLGQGRDGEAEKLFLQTLEIRKRTLGEEHPSTLICMNNLALAYSRQRRYDEAEKLRLQILEITKRTLGEEHPDTLVTMNNLAANWGLQARYDEALKLRLQTLEIRKRTLGEEHPHTVANVNNLALVYLSLARTQGAAGKREAATASSQQVIDLLMAVAEERRGGNGWGYLARALYFVGRWGEAREAFEKGNALRGDEGPTLRKGPRWWYLAMTLHQLGETEQARAYYDALLKEMNENPPGYDSERFRAEAAKLLGIENDPETETKGETSEQPASAF